nr:integrase, catalytic region, zinc finger, CCHC-type, peptidase aspartic, catalytic [Tanacetum cinerariifolium]
AKRALFTFPIAAKTRFLDATLIAAKTRLVVANPSKAQNKVSSSTLSTLDSKKASTPSKYMKSKAQTSKIAKMLCHWIVDGGCSKHMTMNLKLLRNFVEKFMRTICFGNDHFNAITSYGDFVHENVTICYVYYVEGLGHNLFSVGKFCDGDLEVA